MDTKHANVIEQAAAADVEKAAADAAAERSATEASATARDSSVIPAVSRAPISLPSGVGRNPFASR